MIYPDSSYMSGILHNRGINFCPKKHLRNCLSQGPSAQGTCGLRTSRQIEEAVVSKRRWPLLYSFYARVHVAIWLLPELSLSVLSLLHRTIGNP
jgi:hypothetical protein